MSTTTPGREPLEGLRRHKLLPVEMARTIPKLYSQDGRGDQAIVHLKLFNAYGRGTWYITEASVQLTDESISLKDALAVDPEQIADITFFGWCVSPLGPDCDEFGYASFNEMANMKVFGSVPAIERDCYFDVGRTVRACIEENA